MENDLPHGATPIDPDEAECLIQPHVPTRGELDELEEANIQLGLEWAQRRAVLGRKRVDVITEPFLYELHKRMFGEVWDWAGEVRSTDKNIGVDNHVVRAEVRKLIADARSWRENEVYAADELAVRFHHRLLVVHPFPNGNGRHSRLMADLIVQQLGRPPFSWGERSLTTTSELRTAYITALQRADRGKLQSLLGFARS
ncbi:MAG: mobile mystery protein B [Acidimicrobiales bacterium]